MRALNFALALTGCALARAAAADSLAETFRTPPPTARPLVWWHWINGNITREGITAWGSAVRLFSTSMAALRPDQCA